MSSDSSSEIQGDGTMNLLPIFFAAGVLVFIIIGILSCTAGKETSRDDSVDTADELLKEEEERFRKEEEEAEALAKSKEPKKKKKKNKKNKNKNSNTSQEEKDLNEGELEKSINKLSKIFSSCRYLNWIFSYYFTN